LFVVLSDGIQRQLSTKKTDLEPVEVYASIYSPRWGHEDRYTFNFSMERMDISHMARKTAAIWSNTSDPTWEDEKLAATMTND